MPESVKENSHSGSPPDRGMIMQRADGTIQACDAIAAQLLGYSAEQLVGRTILDLSWQPLNRPSPLAPEDFPGNLALRTQQPCRDVSLGFYRPNGEQIWLTVEATPMMQADSTTAVLLILAPALQVQPIAAQNAAQTAPASPVLNGTAAQPQEQQLREQIAATVPGILYVYDLVEGRNVYINRQVGEILGYTPAEIQQMGDRVLATLIHPEDFEGVPAHLQRMQQAKDGQVVELEYRMRRADGEWCWLLAKETLFSRTPEGDAQQILGIAQDISDRKRVEEEHKQIQQQLIQQARVMQECNDRFRLATLAVNGIVFEWNVQTGEVYRSSGLYELIGVQAEAAAPTREWWLERLHPDDFARLQAGIETPSSTPDRYEGEYRVRHADGRWIDVWERGCLRRDPQGRLLGIVGFTTDITDRKRTQTALEAAYERMSIAQRCAQAGLWDWDLTAQEVFWSPEYYVLYGLSYAQAPSYESRLAAVLEEDRERVNREIQAAIAQQQPIHSEFRYHHPTKGIRWFASIGNTIYDPSGNPVRAIGISLDITDTKQREAERTQTRAALQESQARLSLMTELLPQIFWTAKPDGGLDYYNPRWEEYVGLEQSQTLGWDWRPVLHPEDVQKTVDLWTQAIQTGAFYECEHRVRRHDGEYRWHLSRAMPLRNPAGQIIKWYGTAIDIHDLKQTAAALHQSNAILNTINESTETLIYVKDREGRLLMVNPALLVAVGQPAEQVIGHTSLEFHQPRSEAEKIAENDRLVMATGRPQQFEESLEMVGGRRVFLSVKVPYRDEQGNIIGIIGVSSDITDRKRIEIERERLLQQEQIARAEADRANRIKDEFLAVLSHELRSPLNPILGWTKLLQSRQFDQAKTKEALATIERNAKLQTQLIDDLLDISRIMRGKLTLSTASVDLALVIASAMETVRLAAEAKSIQIQPELEAGMSQVLGDAARLQQVVWNLLSNAVKFTPTGGQITIRLTQVETQAQIQVVDRGKGISPQFLPHVFEYFRQEDSTTTRQFGGLGLGLAIVRQIVELHGGTVTVASPGEGQGATFTVCLPLLHGSRETNPDLNATETAVSRSTSTPLSGIRVLVVDDDPDALSFYQVALESLGASVTTATSASTAIQRLGEVTPDILLSDIGMPDTNGYTLIQQIRAIGTAPGQPIPAIAITAYATEQDRKTALSAGFQEHLSKPIDVEALATAILQLLR